MKYTGVAGTVPAPRLPGCQEIQAGAKTGFRNHETAPVRYFSKTFRQVVVIQENITGFFQAVVTAEIHITKMLGFGNAVPPYETSAFNGRRQERGLIHRRHRTQVLRCG